MSTIETILSRAMSDPTFAEQLLADADQALASYDLSVDELAQIKVISRTQFADLPIEVRKSFASTATVGGSGFFQVREEGG